MKKRIIKFPKKHIFTLNVNGLRGRMFYMENKNTNKKIAIEDYINEDKNE